MPSAAATWLGHSTVLVELDGLRLITDPLLGKRAGPLVRLSPKVPEEATSSIDVLLLSHMHSDHADARSLRRIGERGVLTIVPRGAGDWVRKRGLPNVRELASGETAEVDPVRIEAVAADHDGRRLPLGPEAEAVGFVLRGSRTIYFAGDTDLYPEMADLHGSIDLALLPVGGWGSSLGPGHLDPERAAEAARVIAPRVAVPIHWATLALPRPIRRTTPHEFAGQEFAERVAEVAPEVEVRVLAAGERTVLA